MKVIIENCNNIKYGDIFLEKEKLNIFYGINGTGKSTISKAINLFVKNNQDISKLKPFNASDSINPKIELDKSISSVITYNEEYVSQYLFLNNKNGLYENSFEVFMKPENYDEKISNINKILAIVKNFTMNDNTLNLLNINKIEIDKLLKLNKTKKNYNNTNVGKSLNEGNKIINIPKELNSFSNFLNNNDNKTKWYDWHLEGENYILENNCPFCTTKLVNNFNDTCKQLDELFNKKNVESLMKTQNIIDNLNETLGKVETQELNNILNNENPIDNESREYIVNFMIEYNTIYESIIYFNELNFISLININNLEVEIENKKIIIEKLKYFNSKKMIEVFDEFNKKIDELIGKVKSLNKEVGILNKSIREKTSNNIKRINNFLSTVGMNYEVVIKDNQVVLEYIKTDISVDPLEHLSWGEKNCFALSLFLFECISNKYDLIILDDPVSSFDNNKKFAITHYLFGEKKNNLREKTVLLLTHDLEPIINMEIVKKYQFLRSNYLENLNGNIIQKKIEKTDINSIIDVSKECYSNKNINIINRLVHLRRYLELSNELNLEYNMISSLFKGKDIPAVLNKHSRSERNFTSEEFKLASTKITEYIPEFDYESCIKIINNKKEILDIYNLSSNNYEKIEIFRIICHTHKILNKTDDVVAKFINEAFHIENSYIFQLNPYSYNLVPDYIIDKCKVILKERFVVEENIFV